MSVSFEPVSPLKEDIWMNVAIIDVFFLLLRRRVNKTTNRLK